MPAHLFSDSQFAAIYQQPDRCSPGYQERVPMFFLLEPDNYARVHSLFEEVTYHLAVVTVLAGNVPGRIYVDDPVNPETAILISFNKYRIYVSGSPKQNMLGDIIHMLFTESPGDSYGFLIYYNGSAAWKQTFEQLLKQQESFSGSRQFYRLREPSRQWNKPLPQNITIGQIDEAMVIDATLANRHLLFDEIHAESPSLEHFFRQNFGFSAQDGHQLVAWCLAEYHYQSRYELGIETLEAYQHKGIATHLTSAVIKHAFSKGATEIGWHCWAANKPSIATALKAGFEKVLDYPVYFCLYRQTPL